MAEPSGSDVVVYEAPDGSVRVDVRLIDETVWLSLNQMAELFGRDKSVVSRHLRGVFQAGELTRAAVVAKQATTAADGKSYQVEYFNLDAIISVGYRVNSRRGVSFRQWATTTLRDHLVRGYTLNRQRFEANARALEAALALVRATASGELLTTDQGRGLVEVIARYTQTFLLLQRYDEGLLTEPQGVAGGALATVAEARDAVAQLRGDLIARGEATAGDLRERGAP